MVGHPRLALALLGLGAVHGLPTQQGDEVEKRGPQFMGPPSSSFGPGDLPRVDPAAPCNPLTDTACWWPFATAPPTTEDGGASFSFGGLPRRDGGEKAKRTSVDELKAEIIDLEHRLERLQNLQDKTRDDWEEIRWLRRELERVAGIVRIIAPPGTSTTFTPGKRDETHSNQERQLMFPGSSGNGNYDPSCPSINEAARFLDKILSSIDRGRLPRWSEDFAIQAFEVALDQCGMGLEEIDDGEGAILEVYRKDDRSHSGGHRLWPRAAEGQYDVTGLQEAHDVMIQTLDNANPSIATWMILKQMEAELAAQGATPEFAKRQSGGVIAIGQGACQLADILALKAALAALSVAYGSDASKLPASIYLIQQVIVSALQICHQDVPGWTSITPGTPQPGGPLIPEKPVPGGAIIPDRPGSGGGSIIPDRPGEGGRIIPDRPGDGGRINPDRPGEGGSIRPSD